jgi:hypothetical protein
MPATPEQPAQPAQSAPESTTQDQPSPKRQKCTIRDALEQAAMEAGLDVDTHLAVVELVDLLSAKRFSQPTARRQLRALLERFESIKPEPKPTTPTLLSAVMEQLQKLGAVLAQLEELEEPEKPSAEDIKTHLIQVLQQLGYSAQLFQQANNRKANQKPSAVEKPEEPERPSPQSIQTQLDAIRAYTEDIQVAIDAIFNAEGAPDLDDIAAVVAANKNIVLLLDGINPPHTPRV